MTPEVTSAETTNNAETTNTGTTNTGTSAPGVTVSPRDTVKLSRIVPIAACLGAAGFAVFVPMGYPLAGAFFCGGLGLGLFNMALVQRSAARFAMSGEPDKRRFAMSVLVRLALVTALAVGLALALRPDGLAVFGGLAACQLLMILMASVPLVKELRRSRVGVPHDD